MPRVVANRGPADSAQIERQECEEQNGRDVEHRPEPEYLRSGGVEREADGCRDVARTTLVRHQEHDQQVPGDAHLDADEHRERNQRPPDPILHVEPESSLDVPQHDREGHDQCDRRDRVVDVAFDLVVEGEDGQVVVPDEIGQHEPCEQDGGEDHRHATPHADDLPHVRRRRELHRDGERHQDVAGLAPRAGPRLGPRLSNDERNHDHDEHGEIRVVLHVDEPVSEVREVQVQERKEVPPRLQEIPEGQRDEQRGEQHDHAVEPDPRRRPRGIQPRRREQGNRRVGS